MASETRERDLTIRGLRVRYSEVIVAGHTVELALSYDIGEAEAVHGRPFNDDMDRQIQQGMFAINRISGDGTIGKVVAAPGSVLEGKCIRRAQIGHCREIEPESAGWSIYRDGVKVERAPWSCVEGEPPRSHSDLG